MFALSGIAAGRAGRQHEALEVAAQRIEEVRVARRLVDHGAQVVADDEARARRLGNFDPDLLAEQGRGYRRCDRADIVAQRRGTIMERARLEPLPATRPPPDYLPPRGVRGADPHEGSAQTNSAALLSPFGT